MVSIREQVKAITGAVVAGLGTLATALADGQVTSLEWAVVALATATAYGTVYRIPQPAPLPHLSSVELFELAERAERREQA